MRSIVYEGCDIYKILIRDTGLTRKQLADWAITAFNNEEMDLPPDDILSYSVWIQPMREVMSPIIILSEEDYYIGRQTHWV